MTKGYQGEGTVVRPIYKSSHSALKPRVVLGNAHREVRIMDSPAPRMKHQEWEKTVCLYTQPVLSHRIV